MSVRADALNAVDRDWHRASDIHKRGGLWNIRSVRDALVTLADEGAVEKRSVPCPGGNVMHEYRLPQKETAS